MNNARKKAIKAAKGTGHQFDQDVNMEVIRDFGPSWIKSEYWVEMVDKVWNTPEWRAKAKAKAAQENRLTEHYGVVGKHTGGSISMTQHRTRLEEKKGRKATIMEVFEKTHKRKVETNDGTTSLEFVTPKAQAVLESYQSVIIEKYGEDITKHPVGDSQVWEQCVGGKKKGRVYGCGSSNDHVYVLTGSPVGSSSGSYVTSDGRGNEEGNARVARDR